MPDWQPIVTPERKPNLFVGGPLDGQRRNVDVNTVTYRHTQINDRMFAVYHKTAANTFLFYGKEAKET